MGKNMNYDFDNFNLDLFDEGNSILYVALDPTDLEEDEDE